MEIHIREMGMAYRRLLVRSTSSYPPPRRRTRDLVTILWDCVRHGPGRIDLHELVRDNPSPFPNRLLFARCPLRLVDEEKRAGVDGVDGDRLTRLASIFLSERAKERDRSGKERAGQTESTHSRRTRRFCLSRCRCCSDGAGPAKQTPFRLPNARSGTCPTEQ